VIPALIPVRFDPSIAGKVPVRFAAGRFVRLAPLPENVVPVIVPFTSKAVDGVVSPIPTFPSFSIVNLLLPPTAKFKG